ncbi:MAG: hypothetical protein JNK87_15565 [Bryobacterales bacterium]|nr:hypothetical protein [Bryobacterales bacterium]
MLTIRHEQLEALGEARRQAFVRRLHGFVREWKADVPEAEVEMGVRKATEFGFTRETDVASFVEIVCLDLDGFGQPLPRQALAYLTAHGADPEQKLERLARWAATR